MTDPRAKAVNVLMVLLDLGERFAKVKIPQAALMSLINKVTQEVQQVNDHPMATQQPPQEETQQPPQAPQGIVGQQMGAQ